MTAQIYVLGFVFDKNTRDLLLIKKKKPVWQNGLLNGIGGKIEDGETELQAMIREFREETGGICTIAEDWKLFCTLNGTTWNVSCFVSELNNLEQLWNNRNISAPMEQETVHLISSQDVQELIKSGKTIPNLCWLIPMAELSISGREINSFMKTAKIYYNDI
jgi:8-oxo-dGTP diphosphatase